MPLYEVAAPKKSNHKLDLLNFKQLGRMSGKTYYKIKNLLLCILRSPANPFETSPDSAKLQANTILQYPHLATM